MTDLEYTVCISERTSLVLSLLCSMMCLMNQRLVSKHGIRLLDRAASEGKAKNAPIDVMN